jgi:hypothetical protein
VSIEQSFLTFHNENPHVYAGLRELALGLRARGYKRYGIKGLYEVLRWRTAMATRGSEFKLNNNHTSRYARMLMENEPGLDGFFELRSIAATTQED